MSPTTRHKVFISYHHEEDEYYRQRFEKLFERHFHVMVSRAVREGDIDEKSKPANILRQIREKYLSDSSVTVVLIGAYTWQRKYVDWEISASLRDTDHNPRSGLLGLILPTYPFHDLDKYDPYTLPPRLADNIDCGYAGIHNWSEDPEEIQGWIHAAFQARTSLLPHNSRPLFANNRTGIRWQ